MKKALCNILPVLAVALVVAMISGAALAQITTSQPNYVPESYDVFTTNYFSNNNVTGAPHGTLRVTNDGSSEDDLCANVYVFDDSQEFKECCSCPITPNGMRTWDINTDLNSNPANGVVANQGEIQIISTHSNNWNGPCDPTFGAQIFTGGNIYVPLEPELEAWATHVQVSNLPSKKPLVNPTYSLTETEAIEEELSYDELAFLVRECAFVTAGPGQGQGSGSGRGTCGCGFEL